MGDDDGKEDDMKDTYGPVGKADFIVPDDSPAHDMRPSGMRHSIRPRRMLTRPADVAVTRSSEPDTLDIVPHREGYSSDVEVPRWQDLPEEDFGERKQFEGHAPLVDFHRDGPLRRAFDLLRTRLRQTSQENHWTNIAVAAPTSGCGNTFTAVNLALSLARVPASRTMLMDFNLRNSGVAQTLGMTPRGSMRDFLTGQTGMRDHIVRVGDTLALGLNDSAEVDAAETLQDPGTELTLSRTRAALRPDLVLYDMPPMLEHDDVSAFLPQLDGVLLVSDGTQTMARQLAECERMLNGHVPLLGVILNRARASSIKKY